MDQYEGEQKYLLYLAGAQPTGRSKTGPITPADYAAVYSPPTNLVNAICSPCLIWRHSLTAGGYGYLQINGRPRRARRVAYEMTRGTISTNQLILHMCHRRACVQPAHLYLGTAQDNATGRCDRFQKGHYHQRHTWAEVQRDQDRMDDGMRYYWDEPDHLEPPLFQANHGAHTCQFTIPIGEINIPGQLIIQSRMCSTCFQSDPPANTLDPSCSNVFKWTIDDEARDRDTFRQDLEPFFIGRKPGDPPLPIKRR